MPSLLDSALLRLDPERVTLDDDFVIADPLAVLDRWVDRMQHKWACVECGSRGRLRAAALVCDVCGEEAATFVSA